MDCFFLFLFILSSVLPSYFSSLGLLCVYIVDLVQFSSHYFHPSSRSFRNSSKDLFIGADHRHQQTMENLFFFFHHHHLIFVQIFLLLSFDLFPGISSKHHWHQDHFLVRWASFSSSSFFKICSIQLMLSFLFEIKFEKIGKRETENPLV